MDFLAQLGIKGQATTVSGLVASAVLLIVLGVLLAFYVPFYLFLLGVMLLRDPHSSPDQHLLLLGFTILGAAALSLLCLAAGFALTRSRRWAANVAIGWGLLLIYFGSRIIIDLFRPYQPGAVQGEDLFEFLIALPCIAVGIWWCVYLSLPRVRTHLRAVRAY
jgi:hypothetical protein